MGLTKETEIPEVRKPLFTPYDSTESLSIQLKSDIEKEVQNHIEDIKKISFEKVIRILRNVPLLCKLNYNALELRKIRMANPLKHHPIKPIRGEIYNALITENIGSEINNNHLIVVISNEKTNIYADKINVLPIEGDGSVVPNYLEQLTNSDLEYGHLDKNPSRVIIPEILTIDKARLEQKIGKIKKEKIDRISKKIQKQLDL